MPANGWLRFALLLGLVLVSMLYGMVSYSQQLPPYGAVDWLHGSLFDADRDSAAAAERPATAAPPIRFENAADIDSARARLIAVLWGDTALPARLPASVERDIRDSLFDSVSGVDRIDRLLIEMDFGLRSVAYHFLPSEPNGRVVIYHTGHGQQLFEANLLITMLAQEGYAVVGLEMPLEGANRESNSARVPGGRVLLAAHAHFDLLRPERGHPMQYFLEPVVVALNHAEREFGYSDVAMIGLSGGGWTTTLMAAIDRRIRLSFPVAGSFPRYLRVTTAEIGDWEQRAPAVYDLVGYRELYVMGAHGDGRKQVQVLNLYDPCCFSGLGWQTYVEEVAGTVSRIGPGEFHVLADDTHEQHAISGLIAGYILRELKR